MRGLSANEYGLMRAVIANQTEIGSPFQLDTTFGSDTLAALYTRGLLSQTRCMCPAREGLHAHFQPTASGRTALACADAARSVEVT
jgi:hypothetical protein